jgi:hypothetical protein
MAIPESSRSGRSLCTCHMPPKIACAECGTLGSGRPWVRYDNDAGRCGTCGAHPYQHADTNAQRVADHHAAFYAANPTRNPLPISVNGLVLAGIAPAAANAIFNQLTGLDGSSFNYSQAQLADRESRLNCNINHGLLHQSGIDGARGIIESGRMNKGSGGIAAGGIYFAVTPDDTMYVVCVCVCACVRACVRAPARVRCGAVRRVTRARARV